VKVVRWLERAEAEDMVRAAIARYETKGGGKP